MSEKTWIKLAGELYLNMSTGDLQMRYGPSGWHKTKLGNIKGTTTFNSVVSTYGTPKGKSVRLRAAQAIMKSIKYK